MSIKIIMTKGLPGSGKTTWAKKYQEDNPSTVRVNKDELRAMVHNSVHSKGREKFVMELRDFIVRNAVIQGHSVIVDDTNFHPSHFETMRHIAEEQGAQLIWQDFSEVPLEECISRDQKRTKKVGAEVIRNMYNKYLRKEVQAVQNDPLLPDAIICDLDGTLALFGNANPYDRDFTKDILNPALERILAWRGWSIQDSQEDIHLFLVSGRQEKSREQTEIWLHRNNISYDGLFMRPTDDVRKDVIVKQEIYDREIKGKYNVIFVLDDRNSVVEMWRNQGITCLQVAAGDF